MSGQTMAELEPLTSINGKHDAYCHVCWLPIYRLWCAPESPDYSRCAIGDYTAQTCPNSMNDARSRRDVADLKARGLWPSQPSDRPPDGGGG